MLCVTLLKSAIILNKCFFNCLDFRARNITSAMMEKDRALMEKEEEVSN